MLPENNANGNAINYTATITDQDMVKASDSMGINRLLHLKCNADEKRQEAKDLVERLRGSITLLVPIEENVREIMILHGPHTIGENPSVLRGWIKSWFTSHGQASKQERIGDYLKRLSEIEAKISGVNEGNIDDILEELHEVGGLINISIARIRISFRSLAYTSGFCKQITENMVSKIGYKEYKDEAKMYYDTIVMAAPMLHLELWTQTEFPVWCDVASQGLSLMTEMTHQRVRVEKLVVRDRRRKTKTIATVTLFIAIVIAVAMCVVLFMPNQLAMQSLGTTRLPLIWVPWPVLVWSLIGSLAAILHRLNEETIYSFDSIFRWLLIRPVQGVILGAAMYLIVAAGLFILNGSTSIDIPKPGATLSTSEVVILVLCFLIGFSDKFADNILNTVVKRYTISQDSADKKSKKAN